MTALYGHLGEISASLKAGKVEGVHDHAEAIGPSLKDFDKDTLLTATKKDFVKLQAQVDLLDKQFVYSHKPDGAEKPRGRGRPYRNKKDEAMNARKNVEGSAPDFKFQALLTLIFAGLFALLSGCAMEHDAMGNPSGIPSYSPDW